MLFSKKIFQQEKCSNRLKFTGRSCNLTPARQVGTRFTYTKGWKAELIQVTGYIPRWFTSPQTITNQSTNLAVHGQESNSKPVDYSPMP